jgi:hypothetical protein
VEEGDGKRVRFGFWVPFFLGVAAFGSVALTIRDPGLTWDESIYFGFSQRYCLFASEFGRGDWYDLPEMPQALRERYRDLPRPWGAFSRPVTYLFWRSGQAHPPLGAICYAIGLGAFSSVTDVVTAFRLPAACIFAGLVLATYFFFSWAPPPDAGALSGDDRSARAERRVWVGAVAAASLMGMPRIFGHGHFAALDVPSALTWLLSVAAFRNGMRSKPWAAASGILFGIALLTKVNAVFLPFVLWPWGLIAYGRKSVWGIVSMIVLGPAVFVAGWPWLWHETSANIGAYLADKLSRMHIAVYYLGKTYDQYPPPWHYPFMLTAVTVPAGLLVAALIGLWRAIKGIAVDPFYSLVLMNLLVVYAVAAFPGVPKYDGVRLFLPAFPFVAGLAALGLEWAWRRLSEALGERRFVLYVGAAAFALITVQGVARYHPYELSYYNALVGGLRGAHRLGFETEYWGDVFNQQAVDAVNKLCARDSTVCVYPLDIRVPQLLQAVGELRGDLSFVAEWESVPCDYLVLLAREGYFSDREWQLYQRAQPVWQSRLRGVPLCMIFRLR